jgi:CubicO group peptidase (beta-lactamase class C family)
MEEAAMTANLTRRSLLGLMGAVPIAAGTALALPLIADAGSTATPAHRPPAGAIPRDLLPGGAFDQLIAGYAARDQFSGTVLLTYRGSQVLARAYGMANKQTNTANRLDTIFPLASAGKPFTGTAVVQLAAQGKIDFNGTLGTYLDGFPASIANTVTVHQLLTHTSGMGDYLASPQWMSNAAGFTSVSQEFDAALAIIRAAPLLFTPGSSASYSNSGYFTLGAIVAAVSGLSYYDYLRSHVFGTAGMATADFYPKPRRLTDPRIAHSYATQPSGQRTDVTALGPYVGTPSGDACASAVDMAAFGRALAGAHLLSPAYTALMTSGKVPTAVGAFQAYGILAAIVHNQRVLLHGGGSPGESTNISIYPDLDWVAVVLSNYDFDLSPVLRLQDQLITQTG